MADFNDIVYDAAGLVPAVVRCARSGEVLMLAQLDAAAVRMTRDSGVLHRRSPSAGEPPRTVREMRLSGAGDCLLVTVEPGDVPGDGFPSVLLSADGGGAAQGDILEQVYQVVLQRRDNPSQKSYVASLFAKGLDKILGKVGEEATETAVAGKGGNPDEVIYEVSDLFFHVLVLLGYYDLPPERIYAELRRRFGLSGIEEKAARKA